MEPIRALTQEATKGSEESVDGKPARIYDTILAKSRKGHPMHCGVRGATNLILSVSRVRWETKETTHVAPPVI